MAASNASADAGADAAERVLVITRVFDAPRELVFKLWTDPAHARHWMGPRGFTATHFEQDPRPGGAWRACVGRGKHASRRHLSVHPASTA